MKKRELREIIREEIKRLEESSRENEINNLIDEIEANHYTDFECESRHEREVDEVYDEGGYKRYSKRHWSATYAFKKTADLAEFVEELLDKTDIPIADIYVN